MELLACLRAVFAGIVRWVTKQRPDGATTPLISPVEPATYPVFASSEAHLQGETSSEVPSHLELEHKIFLSHSGVQKKFVEQLFVDFERKNQHPFFDKANHSLKKGKEWPNLIFKAATQCTVAIIILTEEYLISKWPMLELLAFIDGQKTNPDLNLLPVFFGIKVSDLDEKVSLDRWEMEWKKLITSTGESTSQRDSSSSQSKRITLTLKTCKEALKKLKMTNGINAEQYSGSDVQLRTAIIEYTLELLPKNPDIDTKDIRGCDRLCEILSGMFQARDNSSNEVQCLGLYGMGGLGKTTMCRALCSHFSRQFNTRVCHLEFGVKESDRSKRQLDRQKMVLRKLTETDPDTAERIQDSAEARVFLEDRLRRQPVFLAIDNVQDDEVSRKEAQNYLSYICCPGSKALITSRSRDLVKAVLRDPICCKPIPNIDYEEAMQLFLDIAKPGMELSLLKQQETQIIQKCLECCFFPFEEETAHDVGQDFPVGNTNILPKVNAKSDSSKSGQYHPLALRAIASYFSDENILSWEQSLDDPKLRLMLHHSRESEAIFNILGLGFDTLCDKGKQLFVDVALYKPPLFSGDEILKWLFGIYDGPNKVIIMKLKDLQRKSFLSFQEDSGIITVHDLYKEFATRYIENNQHTKLGIHIVENTAVMACRDWSINIPRVSLLRVNFVSIPNVQDWLRAATVVHIVDCGHIYDFPIGDLIHLRHLLISGCSSLEALSWTQNMVTDDDSYQPVQKASFRREWGMQLRFVQLLFNRNLKNLPNLSNCSNLQSLLVTGCSSSVEPVSIQSCSNLERLQFVGEDVPNVELLQSCSKLMSAELSWRMSSHGGIQIMKYLPKLLELVINGPPSVVPRSYLYLSHKQIQDLFQQRYPVNTICHDLLEVTTLTHLQKIHLKYIPLGQLPKGLERLGSCLINLSLRGCLLRELVDFSSLTNLQQLSVAWTNVKEVRGIGRLLKLEELDCSFCFQLQTISDLNRLSKLVFLSVKCCHKLDSIPRLPLEYYNGDEEKSRVLHALSSGPIIGTMLPIHRVRAFSTTNFRTAASFKNSEDFFRQRDIVESTSEMKEAAVHWTVCNGCEEFPIVGTRFKAKNVRIAVDICNECFRTRKCDIKGHHLRFRRDNMYYYPNYNLCLACFKISGWDRKLFYRLDKTLISDEHTIVRRSNGERVDDRVEALRQYVDVQETDSAGVLIWEYVYLEWLLHQLQNCNSRARIEHYVGRLEREGISVKVKTLCSPSDQRQQLSPSTSDE